MKSVHLPSCPLLTVHCQRDVEGKAGQTPCSRVDGHGRPDGLPQSSQRSCSLQVRTHPLSGLNMRYPICRKVLLLLRFSGEALAAVGRRCRRDRFRCCENSLMNQIGGRNSLPRRRRYTYRRATVSRSVSVDGQGLNK